MTAAPAANRIDAQPDYMLVMGGRFMGGAGLGGAELVDMSYRISGDNKRSMLAEIERIIAFHEENTLPLIGPRSRVQR